MEIDLIFLKTIQRGREKHRRVGRGEKERGKEVL